MNSKIYEFDPVLYPVKLWVCKKPDVKDVNSVLYALDENAEIVDDGFGESLDDFGAYAKTFLAGNKKSNLKGCLVVLIRPGECRAGICSHEALHFVAYCSEMFDIPLGTFMHSEPLAYLEQWATNCIDCVRTGHPELMGGSLLE